MIKKLLKEITKVLLKKLSDKQLLWLVENVKDKNTSLNILAIYLHRYAKNIQFPLKSVNTSSCSIVAGRWKYGVFNICFLENMISNVIYCYSKGFIPSIDVCSKDDGSNLWTQFLQQPNSNASIYGRENESDDLPLCDMKHAPLIFPAFPTKRDIQLFSKLYKNIVIFNEETEKYILNEYVTIMKGKRVVGVLCRGTDYTDTRPKSHPIQPDIESLMNHVKKIKNEYNCDYIYLATEEYAIYLKFVETFGNIILTNKRTYFDDYYKLKQVLGNETRIGHVEEERKNDKKLKSLEYLSSIYLLSKCQTLVAGSCGGSRAALYLNDGKYEYQYLFNIGVY